MLESVKISRRQSEIRQALAGLSRTEAAHLLDDLSLLSDANRA